MRRQLLQKFALLVLTLGFVLSLKAQVTTSAISGTVTDKTTKETLIGASVMAKHLPTGTTYGAVTNEKGNYSLNGLRPGGPYTIEVSYIGYNKKVFKGVTLSLGNTEYLNVWLGEDAKQLEQVVVLGSKDAGFNSKRTGASANFGRKAIEMAPNVNRSLFDVAKLTPQANVTGNGISFAGSNNRYNSFQIDGTVSNDVFGLSDTGTNGGKTGSNPISLEAIDALQVVIAPFDVRQGGFTGGGINAVTKSGTNTFKGSAYDFYKNQDFYGSTPGKMKEKQERKQLGEQYDNTAGFTLGGPIVEDKLFFFVNGEYSKSSYPSSYNLGNGSLIEPEEAKQVKDKLMELTGGYDGGGFAPTTIPTTSFKALARLDWNINQAHKLSVRYSFLDAKKKDFGNGANSLNFNHTAYDYTNQTHSIVTELNSRFSNKVSNELRFGYTRVRDNKTISGQGLPSVKVKLDNNRSITFGSNPFASANRLDQDVWTLTDNLNINLGDHSITLGTHNEFFDMYNLFIARNYGAYEYSSLADFLSVGTANEAMPRNYTYNTADVAVTGTKNWGPSFKAMQLGFYLQDQWKVTDKLRLTYGLRMDLPVFFESPRANQFFNESAIAKSNDLLNDRMPKLTPLWSPRVGFRYNVDEENKYLIRGGAGVFTGRIPFVWISNNFTNTGVEFQGTYLTKFDPAHAPGFKFSIDPHNQYILKRNGRSTSEVDFISKNFKFPQVARFNLAFDAKLPGGVKATIEGMFTKNLNNILYRNLNQKPTGKYLTHNAELKRPEFAKVDRNFTYLIMLDNTNKGYAYNFTASLSKSFNFGLSASLAYTYGKSMGVMAGRASIANSSWRYQAVFDSTNAEEVSYTDFDVRHRIVANLNYRVEYLKHFATTIGIYYNGQSGPHFSMNYYGDVNKDGEQFNDLAYLPTDTEIDANFSAKDATNLKKFITENEQFANYQGTFIPRNGLDMPFVHNLDLHFAQDFFFNVAGKRHTIQLNADIQNFGNLLNREWGLRHSVRNSAISPISYKEGKYSFRAPRQIWDMNDIASRWHAQVGVKYIF